MSDNALQNFDMLHSGFLRGLGAVSANNADSQMQRSYYAAVDGYNDLVYRYRELSAASQHTTDRLLQALEASRRDNDYLRMQLRDRK
jgi:hypothetical protein